LNGLDLLKGCLSTFIVCDKVQASQIWFWYGKMVWFRGSKRADNSILDLALSWHFSVANQYGILANESNRRDRITYRVGESIFWGDARSFNVCCCCESATYEVSRKCMWMLKSSLARWCESS